MVIATIILVYILQFRRWKQYGKVLKLFLTCFTWIYKSKIIIEIFAHIETKLNIYLLHIPTNQILSTAPFDNHVHFCIFLYNSNEHDYNLLFLQKIYIFLY